MRLEGQIVCYSSDRDDDTMVDNENVVENENDQEPIAPVPVVKKRGRGKGRSWIIIAKYPSLPDGFTHIESLNKPVVSRLKGRITRGKTNAYYYLCTKVSCGCTKQWRLSTDLYSAVVTEEESRGDHCNHDLYKRNGGRGLSDAQVTIISEAFAMGIKKPASVLEVFHMRADAIHDAGLLISQLAFDAHVFFLYLTGVKHFILWPVASARSAFYF
jgi:hypothetical protein